ncbi:hypothetical protein ABBQ38_007474 [Trebouxia sp. C0009 RCD-2024]
MQSAQRISSDVCAHALLSNRAITCVLRLKDRRQQHGTRRQANRHCCCSMAESRTDTIEEPLKEPLSQELDVSNSVVDASYRSTPWAAQREKDASTSSVIQILMVSESNVCRSVLAEAILKQQLADCGLGKMVQVQSKGTREYNVGDGPDIAAQAAAQQMGIELREDFQARQINPERDIVQFDVVLVMDKFTAADVLREVSVYDTINKDAQYSLKVRRLGEYHPGLAATKDQEGQDIGDPLYGNVGGVDELADVEQTAEVIREACNGFVQFLLQLKGKCADGAAFRTALQDEVRNMQDIDWLKPPMLSKA